MRKPTGRGDCARGTWPATLIAASKTNATRLVSALIVDSRFPPPPYTSEFCEHLLHRRRSFRVSLPIHAELLLPTGGGARIYRRAVRSASSGVASVSAAAAQALPACEIHWSCAYGKPLSK